MIVPRALNLTQAPCGWFCLSGRDPELLQHVAVARCRMRAQPGRGSRDRRRQQTDLDQAFAQGWRASEFLEYGQAAVLVVREELHHLHEVVILRLEQVTRDRRDLVGWALLPAGAGREDLLQDLDGKWPERWLRQSIPFSLPRFPFVVEILRAALSSLGVPIVDIPRTVR